MIPGSPFIVVLITLFASAIPAAQANGEIQERLRHRLEVLDEPGELVAGNATLYAVPALISFYEGRAWLPAWVGEEGRPTEAFQGLVPALRVAADHGLNPEDYHLDALRESLAGLQEDRQERLDARVLADIELLASDAFLTLADHYADGRVDPESIDPGWFLERERRELVSSLSRAVTDGRNGPRLALRSLLPASAEYRVLVDHLAMQHELSGNAAWETIQAGRALKPGDSDPAIPLIRQRLAQLGDLPSGETPAHRERYDDALQAAVRRFQARHGLEEDGVIGRDTIGELNTSPAERIDQIRANLERWRWLPRSLGDDYIVVNIAAFRMELISGGERVMDSRAIVGLPYRRTPVFSGRMTYLVLNPSWEVPYRLAVQDKLPEILDDPYYLSRLGFKVLQGWGAEETVIDPATVNWSELSRSHFPYRLRQAPGPANALGQVKFMFPNTHNVYLHDTPTRGLFAETQRAFSSGCIRLEEPIGLAEWLLSGPGRRKVMTPDEIRRILASGKETTVPLQDPVPVHLLYWTAWVDEDDRVQYRRDIYGRDAPLIEALNRPAPAQSR